MRMRGEEQLLENLFVPQILLLRQAGARAMPPLSEVGRALCAESDGFCIDERFYSPVALALRVYPPQARVDSLGIACSAFRLA
jgi:hypothetical protein